VVVAGAAASTEVKFKKVRAEKSGNIILVFGFRRKQIIARGGCY
jgi:hypothetical protein